MTEFEARMAALRERFVARALGEAVEIEVQRAAGLWEDLRDTSHGLSGRAGMFGFAAIGDAARAVEEAIDDGAPPEVVRALAAVLLARIGELI